VQLEYNTSLRHTAALADHVKTNALSVTDLVSLLGDNYLLVG